MSDLQLPGRQTKHTPEQIANRRECRSYTFSIHFTVRHKNFSRKIGGGQNAGSKSVVYIRECGEFMLIVMVKVIESKSI